MKKSSSYLNHLGLPIEMYVWRLVEVLSVSRQRSYIWQVPQLVVEHALQGELPPIGVDVPSLLLEKEAKEENIRLAPLRQRGQEALSSAWVWRQSTSNLKLQSGQKYS
jgi:hypothetical protein